MSSLLSTHGGKYFNVYYLSVNDIFDNTHISTIDTYADRTKRFIEPEHMNVSGVT